MSILFNNVYSLPHIETPYLIDRLTYAECQAYHSTLTLGYVIKNLDEKFKVVAVANNSNIYNSGYTYGDTNVPYNAPDILNSSWYELRIYCDDSIMNLGEFSLHSTVTSNTINYTGDGRYVTYDASGKYYSLYRSDRDESSVYGGISEQERNLRTQIMYSMQRIYNDAYSYDPSSFNYDIIRTVDILFEYSRNYELLAEGTIVTLSEDKTKLDIVYNSRNVPINYFVILVNSQQIASSPNQYVYSYAYSVDLNPSLFRTGDNSIEVRTFKRDNSVSINEINFTYP